MRKGQFSANTRLSKPSFFRCKILNSAAELRSSVVRLGTRSALAVAHCVAGTESSLAHSVLRQEGRAAIAGAKPSLLRTSNSRR